MNPQEGKVHHALESPFAIQDLSLGKKFDPYCATILGLLRYKEMYWGDQNRLTKDGFFYITVEDIQCLTGYAQSTINEKIKKMKNHGILMVDRRIVGKDITKRVNHYKIDYNKWMEITTEFQGTFYKHVPPYLGGTQDRISVPYTNNQFTNNQIVCSKEQTMGFAQNRAKPKVDLKLDSPCKNNPPAPPERLAPILDQYYSIVQKNRPSPGTESFKKDIDYLKKLKFGTLFNHFPTLKKYHNKKFTYAEIYHVLDLHKKACGPEYENTDKKHYHYRYFHEWLINPYAGSIVSWFCHWLDNPPKLRGKINKDENPEVTKELLNLVNQGKPMKPQQMNQLIKASKMLVEFLNNGHGELRPFLKNPKKMAEILYDSVKDDEYIKNINPGILIADYTWSQRMPNYCERNVIFEPPKPQLPAMYRKDV